MAKSTPQSSRPERRPRVGDRVYYHFTAEGRRRSFAATISGVDAKGSPSVDVRVAVIENDDGVVYPRVAQIGAASAPGPIDSDPAWSWIEDLP